MSPPRSGPPPNWRRSHCEWRWMPSFAAMTSRFRSTHRSNYWLNSRGPRMPPRPRRFHHSTGDSSTARRTAPSRLGRCPGIGPASAREHHRGRRATAGARVPRRGRDRAAHAGRAVRETAGRPAQKPNHLRRSADRLTRSCALRSSSRQDRPGAGMRPAAGGPRKIALVPLPDPAASITDHRLCNPCRCSTH